MSNDPPEMCGPCSRPVILLFCRLQRVRSHAPSSASPLDIVSGKICIVVNKERQLKKTRNLKVRLLINAYKNLLEQN